MCYSPITIKNNSKLYRPLVSKDLVKVPCGKCRECVERKKSDWFVRIYYEWLRTKQSGGQTFFITLTYNDVHLPYLDSLSSNFSPLARFLDDLVHDRLDYHLNDVDRHDFESRLDRYIDRYEDASYDVPSFQHACFDDSHVTAFFKSLRQNLNNLGLLKYDDDSLKYYLCCEFGDKKKRPHYHALVFIPKQIDQNVFLKISRRSWSYRVKRADCPDYILSAFADVSASKLRYLNLSTPGTDWKDWHISFQPTSKRYLVTRQRGFVNYSEKGAILDNVEGCRYLTNYLNYYDSYLRDFGFDKLKDYIKLFPNFDYYVGYQDYKKLIHDLNMVFPFRRVSYNFGSSIMDEFNVLTDTEIINKIQKNEIHIPSDTRTYSIPTYILDRLLYERVPVRECLHPVTVLSPIGFEVFKGLYDNKIDMRLKKYQLTLDVLRNFLTKSDYDNFVELYGYSINDILQSPEIGFDLVSLAKFDIVLNGVSVSHCLDNLRLEDMSASQILDNVYDIYINQLSIRYPKLSPPVVLFDDLYYLTINSKRYLKDRSFNSVPQFVYFDKYLTVLYYIYYTVIQRDSQSQNQQYTKNTEVRDAINKFIYPN